MPRNCAVFDLGRSVNDGDHCLPEPRSPLRRVAAGLAGHPSTSDRADDFTFQRTPAVQVDRLINRLGAHPHLQIAGKVLNQPAADLLG
jgi:hypothetical protein